MDSIRRTKRQLCLKKQPLIDNLIRARTRQLHVPQARHLLRLGEVRRREQHRDARPDVLGEVVGQGAGPGDVEGEDTEVRVGVLDAVDDGRGRGPVGEDEERWRGGFYEDHFELFNCELRRCFGYLSDGIDGVLNMSF